MNKKWYIALAFVCMLASVFAVDPVTVPQSKVVPDSKVKTSESTAVQKTTARPVTTQKTVVKHVAIGDYGVGLELGATFVHHQIHNAGVRHAYNKGLFSSYNSYNVGALELGVSYQLPKNVLVYVLTDFGFPAAAKTAVKGYIIDSQFGFGYLWDVKDGFSVFFGGGFALGGSQIWSDANSGDQYTNIGGGLKINGIYMFSKIAGLYFGTSANFYYPIAGNHWVGKNKSKLTKMPAFAQSIAFKLGLQLKI